MAKKSRTAKPEATVTAPVCDAGAGPSIFPGARNNLLLKIGEPLSLAILFAYLLGTTWRRWPDPFVDFPRTLYTAWRLSEGDALYTDVVSWYGPLPHLVEGAAFKIFGPGLDTIIWLNVLVTLACVLLIRKIFFILGGRLAGWLCAVVFLVVFAFGQYVINGNYNFITPYASQATYGFAGLLLVLWAGLRHGATAKFRWLAVAGVGLGITYVNKPEPLLAAGGALAIFWLLNFLRLGRAPSSQGGRSSARAWAGRSLAALAAGFASVWLVVFAVLALKGGAAYAWRYVNWVPHTMLTESITHSGMFSSYGARTFGFDDPARNFILEVQATGWLLLVCGVIIAAAWFWADAPKYRAAWWAALGVAVGTALFAGWRVTWVSMHPVADAAGLGSSPFTWIDIGKPVVIPAIAAAVASVIWCGRAAWRNQPVYNRAFGYAFVGTAACLLLVRMALHGRIYHYGFVLMPLAVCMVIVFLVHEAPRRFAAPGRFNWLLPALFTPLVLLGAAYLHVLSAQLMAEKTLAVGAGRDVFYTFPEDVYPAGEMLNGMLQEIRTRAANARTVLALPESSAVNYHLRRRVGLREIDFLPTTMDFMGASAMFDDLRANPPDIVVYYARPLDEYGAPYFGADERSGADIARWIAGHYENLYSPSLPQRDPASLSGNRYDILVRKADAPAP